METPCKVYLDKDGLFSTVKHPNIDQFELDIIDERFRCFAMNSEGFVGYIEKTVKRNFIKPKKLSTSKKFQNLIYKKFDSTFDTFVVVTSCGRAFIADVSILKLNLLRRTIKASSIKNHFIADFTVFKKTDDVYLLSVTSQGRYKLSSLNEYRYTPPGGKGVKNFNLSSDSVIFCSVVGLGRRLVIKSKGIKKSIVLSVSNIRGRATSGKRLGNFKGLVNCEVNLIDA
ncbi:MAG: DNA gyrase/topoisomerase IV subunit A [Halioglobus sp.]|jgi:DNA gyrase/topoisomerase IV subunit A